MNPRAKAAIPRIKAIQRTYDLTARRRGVYHGVFVAPSDERLRKSAAVHTAKKIGTQVMKGFAGKSWMSPTASVYLTCSQLRSSD